jgi:hypothetical protein
VGNWQIGKFAVDTTKIKWDRKSFADLSKDELKMALIDAVTLLLEEREHLRRNDQLLRMALAVTDKVEFEGQDKRFEKVVVDVLQPTPEEEEDPVYMETVATWLPPALVDAESLGAGQVS